MTLYMVDTHALYWYKFDSPLLSATARRAFEEAEQGQAILILNAIVLAEFYWVLRKESYEQDFPHYLQFIEQCPLYRLEPITWDHLWRLPSFSEIPEMHDRLIAIQAKRLGATIVTKDSHLQSSQQVQCIW